MRPLFWLCVTAALWSGMARAETPGHADLAKALDRIPGQAAFLVSYLVAPDDSSDFAKVNRQTAYTYDNALAILALLAAGDAARARRIGDAFVIAQDHDRFWHDGRLRNAYRAGAVQDADLRLSGWWDGIWREDRYQVGTATGSMAFAGIALFRLSVTTKDKRYSAAAYRIARWIGAETATPEGCFAGGYVGEDAKPEKVTWCSTEHNIDAAVLFRLTGDPHADAARKFVEKMRDPETGRFFTGTTPDRHGINKDHSALDAESLTVAAGLAGADALAAAERIHGVAGLYSFSSDRDTVWIEGSAQMAVAYRRIGNAAKADAIVTALEADRAPGGYWRAARAEMKTGLSTGVKAGVADFTYRPVPHLAATAWVVMAAAGLDPLQ